MNPKKYNKSMVKAISKVSEGGYSIKKISMLEADLVKNELLFARYSVIATRETLTEAYTEWDLTVGVSSYEGAIIEKYEKLY